MLKGALLSLGAPKVKAFFARSERAHEELHAELGREPTPKEHVARVEALGAAEDVAASPIPDRS